MRIWDIEPNRLCRRHLLGEHRELHAIWTILTEQKKEYSKHPETLRWKGKLKALYIRHETLVVEMNRRGFNHRSRLDREKATGNAKQDRFVDQASRQIEILRDKRCSCCLQERITTSANLLEPLISRRN